MDNISIVIPFYNAEEYFNEAYQSIKKQTLQPKEIIVVIDGCGQKAEDFLTSYEDIVLINLAENVGPAEARNIGVKKAKSQWIAFMDSDDKWKNNKLEKQLEFLTKHTDFAACHTGIIVFNKEKTIATYIDKPFDLSVTDLLKTSHVVPTSFIISKKIFNEVGGFDAKLKCSEDHDFTLNLVSNGYRIGFLSDTLAYLRREDHGNISSNGRSLIIGHWQLLKKNFHLFKKSRGATSYFIYKTFMTAGSKSKGIEKKSYYLLGKIFSLFVPKNSQ